jgi:hypothetical protein
MTETIRLATPADAARLRQFRCSTGTWYEDEVEALVRGRVADRLERGAPVWIAEADGELLAVASHTAQHHPTDPSSTITFFNVMASRVDDREAWLIGAARLGRLLRALFADVYSSDRSPYCYTRVARDHERMRRFCERGGFVGSPIPSDPRYLFYTARVERPLRAEDG